MRISPLLLTAALGLAWFGGCDRQSATSDLQIERLPEVRPNVPDVPTLPPPPHPVQYEDHSYSVYGLRRRMQTTIDTDVEVTGYIVEIYQPPPCPTGETCPPAVAPHLWLADTATEPAAAKRLTLAGYAENHESLTEAIELTRRGQYEPPPADSGLLPIPTDFAVGAKIKVRGRFARVSGGGFNISDGLLEYAGHSILPPPPGAPAARAPAAAR